MMGSYFCADGRHIPEGHDTEECPPCLRAHRDGIRRQYEETVDVDLVGKLKELNYRIEQQRKELARLNEQIVRKPLMKPDDAFDAWVIPTLNRWERRAARIAFEAGWQAAKRALDDR